MSAPVLLYDGECGFCDRTVRFVLRHDRRGTLRFAALQGELGRAVRERHPELNEVDSVVWLENAGGAERLYVRSEAALRLALYLGGPWTLARAGRLLPRAVRDGAYDWFARHRYQWFGRAESCGLPSTAERARFIA